MITVYMVLCLLLLIVIIGDILLYKQIIKKIRYIQFTLDMENDAIDELFLHLETKQDKKKPLTKKKK